MLTYPGVLYILPNRLKHKQVIIYLRSQSIIFSILCGIHGCQGQKSLWLYLVAMAKMSSDYTGVVGKQVQDTIRQVRFCNRFLALNVGIQFHKQEIMQDSLVRSLQFLNHLQIQDMLAPSPINSQPCNTNMSKMKIAHG